MSFLGRPARLGRIVRDACHDPVVELTHHVHELLRTAEFLRDLPQSLEIRRVEGSLQVHEGGIEVGPHFLALLLRMADDENHVDGPTLTSESTMAFWEKSLFEMVEEDAGEDLSGDIEQRSSSVVVTQLSTPLRF
ncbi:Peptidyl-prolyl isomerase cwc27 [Sparganum proliferum]